MAEIKKPSTPLKKKDTFFYPQTTADQVITDEGTNQKLSDDFPDFMKKSVYDTDDDGIVEEADHALTADNAKNAEHSNTADTATNAEQLGGVGPTGYLPKDNPVANGILQADSFLTKLHQPWNTGFSNTVTDVNSAEQWVSWVGGAGFCLTYLSNGHTLNGIPTGGNAVYLLTFFSGSQYLCQLALGMGAAVNGVWYRRGGITGTLGAFTKIG